MELKLDIGDFEEAMRLWAQATQKDSVEILNRAARNVAYRAAQFTPVASAAEIKGELLKDPKMVYALTALSLKKQGIGMLPKGEMEKAVQAFIARRVGSRRYLRAGWAQAIIDLGGTFRGSKLQRGSESFANPATIVDLLAEIAWIVQEANEHKAEGAEEKVMPALQEALDFVAKDMIDYAQDRLAKTAAEYSA